MPHVASPGNVHRHEQGLPAVGPSADISGSQSIPGDHRTEDLSDGAFTTQIVGLSLNGLKDMGKNGIQHVAEPTEKQRAIVNGCLESASRAIVNRMAEKFDPFMRTEGPVQ